ncbi:MAG: hypothetical protein OXH15_02355 [Gammaproteobacteria bacterium]|nr:hypothetical protein [Gammaproteobacteria bacterium]
MLFLVRHGRAMRERAATPEALLAMVERIAALEPAHTHRSEHQVAFDQFSTPLALACAAFLAADVRPGDTVLEPSAGTGVLAALPAAAGRRERGEWFVVMPESLQLAGTGTSVLAQTHLAPDQRWPGSATPRRLNADRGAGSGSLQ